MLFFSRRSGSFLGSEEYHEIVLATSLMQPYLSARKCPSSKGFGRKGGTLLSTLRTRTN